MKAPQIATCCLIVLASVGCAEKAGATKTTEDVATKAQEDAAAKARAEAARKEMETLPKVFSTPDYLKKNKTAQPTATATPAKQEPGSK
jgi:hypothetical protein